jgi:hypothetical protein
MLAQRVCMLMSSHLPAAGNRSKALPGELGNRATPCDVMMSWYSIDRNLSIVERGIVSKEDAMRIVEEYCTRGDAIYEYGEDALAATAFGFKKSEAEFVEIRIASADEIWIAYESSMPRKFLSLSFPKMIHKDKTLQRMEDVKIVVSSFYDMDSATFQTLLDA